MNNSGEMARKFSLFALTWPIFIEITLQMLMGNADTLMLSRYSDDAVAAVGVANQLLGIVIVLYGFVAMGSGIVVSQFLGANEHRKASEVAVVAIAVNLIFGLLLSAVLYLFGDLFMRMMGLPPELKDFAMQFVHIVGGFSFVGAVMMTIGSIVRSHGFTRDAMYVTIGMNVLNVAGNYLLLFGPFGMPVLGVAGVSISTSVSRTLGLVAIAILLYKRVNGDLPFRVLLKFPRYALMSILRIGVPAAGENLSYNASQLLITYFISMLGTAALTTKVYTQNIMMFVFMFSLAVSQATQIMVGHFVGAGQKEDAYQACMRSLKLSFLVSLSMAGVFSIFREQLMGFFTDDPSIISMGSKLILMTLILEPGRTYNLVVIAALRAAGDAKFPVYMGILSMWGISASLAYLLGIHYGLGLLGMWIAFTVDEWFRGLFMLWRWRSRKWEKMGFVPSQSKEEQQAQLESATTQA
ncbi:putative MATE family efflux protein [Tumebacillus permanentifrigoris]|uniref:Putative MATE family efflux protein n=2 Tax=Tumebacillus permanentifrigoris TaxID=378543 RepID=A0A316DAF8_9BACL|nr:putative MATE family efflux protein [Tumebacillus permanentifrigoris]